MFLQEAQRPLASAVPKTVGAECLEAPFGNSEESFKETVAIRECRGISSRSSPTASTVSLCSSDSSDSKPNYSVSQNPCDPDALSIGSLGKV